VRSRYVEDARDSYLVEGHWRQFQLKCIDRWLFIPKFAVSCRMWFGVDVFDLVYAGDCSDCL
jgi:hypothetical protein